MAFQNYSTRDWALFILRVALGITLIMHGWPKWAGGGPDSFVRFLRLQHVPAPLLMAWFMAIVELIGGLAILAGFRLTWAGWAAAAEQALVAWFLKLGKGVDFIAARGVGWELNFLLVAIAVALVYLGAGAVTAESMLKSRRSM